MLKRVWRRLVQALFHLLYTLFAPWYDLVAWAVSKGDWRAWGRTALEHTLPGRSLELGVGPGHLLPHLARQTGCAVGVERSPAMLRLAARRCGTAALVGGTALALPFGDGVFGTVVSTFPAPYIVAPATLDEVRRVLRPAGRLVVVDAAELTDRDPYTALINLAYALTSRPLAASPLPARLTARGFALTRHSHATRHGRVSVLVADKLVAETNK